MENCFEWMRIISHPKQERTRFIQPNSFHPNRSTDMTGAGFVKAFKNQNAPKKKFPCYKRYKNSRIFLDEKEKCQPWITKKTPKIG
jgi:hypothetical protein